MRALMRSLAPDSLRGRRRPRRPVPAGPDGGQHAQRLRRPQERPEADRATSTPTPRRSSATPTGLMIYQESVMRVAQKFAGYSLAEADNLRKACGKKIRELIAKEREKFVAGLRDAPATAATLGTQLVRHHRAVRRLRLQQEPLLRLRPHRLPDGLPEGELPGRVPRRPAHRVKANLDKAAVYLTECRHDGHPGARCPTSTGRRPTSSPSRAVDGRHARLIPFGLSAVRNVGEGLVELIVAERDAERALRRLLRLLRPRRHRRCSTSAPSSR